MLTLTNKPMAARSELSLSLSDFSQELLQTQFHRSVGKITEITANRIVTSLRDVFVGEKCVLQNPNSKETFQAQVVGIEGDRSILSPLEGIEGLSAETEVYGTGEPFTINVGDQLVGSVIDGLGRSLIGELDSEAGLQQVSVTPSGNKDDILDRPVIDEVFETGIKVIDGINTIGIGQRIAILGEAGAGKSTLLAMLARHSKADVVILAMIGERGREVTEFLQRQLPEEVRERSIVVASSSDKPAMERLMAGHTALTIADYFRSQGKNVLLLFDSVTRFARALREVGLSAGERAVRNGFTPSVYAELPRLIERSGKTSKGSITAFFTVLTENNGINDPIAEEVTSLTDGHLMLDAKLARSGIYPAINVLSSKSRLMNEIASREAVTSANHVRGLLSKYEEMELLVQVGEYTPGADLVADEAISKNQLIRGYISQDTHDHVGYEVSVQALMELANEPAAASS